jgi:hypothetical protein
MIAQGSGGRRVGRRLEQPPGAALEQQRAGAVGGDDAPPRSTMIAG